MRLVIAVLGVACAAGFGVAVWHLHSTPPPASAPASTLVGGPAVPRQPSALPGSTPSPTGPPARLAIPTLGVDAAVESVGVDGQGRMAVPSRPEDVGWYNQGPAPGESGDAVIDGHLDWWTGPAVFWKLDRLRVGDELTVTRADGSRLRFVVDSMTSVPYDSRPPGLFTSSGMPSLSLVTCAGAWDRTRQTYTTRLLVHAALAPTPVTATPGDGG
jgi:sortase (surface protein transpeptidase)